MWAHSKQVWTGRSDEEYVCVRVLAMSVTPTQTSFKSCVSDSLQSGLGVRERVYTIPLPDNERPVRKREDK